MQLKNGKHSERESYFVRKSMLLIFAGGVLKVFGGWETRMPAKRNGGGESEVKMVGLDSVWRKKEKTYYLEEAVGCHDHSH